MNIVINENGTQDVGKVESLINFYQLMQNVGFVKDARDRYKTNESINLKNLIDTIKKENSRPVLFTISFEDSCATHLLRMTCNITRIRTHTRSKFTTVRCLTVNHFK